MELFILYFFVYSFLGWICESIYCLVIDKVWVNRGFLNGPLCPVYGVGALVVLATLGRFKDNLILLFLISVVLTTVVEYITAVILEKLFNLKWWDYSTYKFNYKGRICLLNSTLFGILSIFLIKVAQPKISVFIDGLHTEYGEILAILISIVCIVDLVVTVLSLINMTKVIEKMCIIKDEFKKREITIDKFTDIDFKSTFEKLKEKNDFNEIKSKFEDFYATVKDLRENSRVQKRILRAFPHIKSMKYGKQFKDIKGSLFEYWNRKK